MRTRVVTAVVCLMLAGCASRPATLPVEWIVAPCATPVDTLLVLLPGAFDRAHDFVDQGFVAAVRDQRIAADIALVDASVPFYRDRDLVPRLEADVVAPARARGIRHLWFAGISIGGLGSLIYANEHRGGVDGLLLIAPYLGERSIVAEVAASGGLAHWAPPGVVPADDDDRRLWQWAKTLAYPPEGTRVPPVWLGFGVDDRFVAAHRLFAAALPADHVFTAPGGHDWPAWRDAWPRMLAAAPLPRGCVPP
jgi:pimeloyl-ACP methyl ester carboxylesterase